MNYKYITCDHIINKITWNDTLFLGNYTIDPYQNCEFGCKYCDSTYDPTIYIKTNACELLNKELADLEKGCIIVGSVHDPYQKAEEKQKITRNLLKTIQKHGFSCHILTKSNLVLRDLDILSNISGCMVTISMISTSGNISNIFEEQVPSPKERLKIVEKLSQHGIKTGVAVMPLLPFIVEGQLEQLIKAASKHKAQYILHKHLELKGDQKKFFMDILKESFPSLVEKYEELYQDNYMPNDEYISGIKDILDSLCVKYNIKNMIT